MFKIIVVQSPCSHIARVALQGHVGPVESV